MALTPPGADRTRVHRRVDLRALLEQEGSLAPHPRPKAQRTARTPTRHYDTRPNVLWLMADQWRGDMLGFLGRHPAIKTPNIDRLAARGVSFTRSYCNQPLCAPSRASMLTGRFIAYHGVYTNGHPMKAEEVCFPTLIAEAGYRTANIGKTHCGRATGSIFEFNDNSPDAFGATKPSDVAFDPAVYPECVFINDELSDNSDDVLYGTYPGPVPTTKSYRLATQAMRFLYYHDDPRPFFLRVSFDDPHPPLVPPEPFASMYGPDDVTPDILEGYREALAGKSRTIRHFYEHSMVKDATPAQLRMHAARYMALCAHLDAQIGRILDYLDELGFTDNTLVFFNSDHGHKLGEYGMLSKGHALSEAENLIPTIISWPGQVPEGIQVDALVEGVDVAATFLDALGIPIPANMHGRSMLPLARGEVAAVHDDVVSQWDEFGFALTGPRWKLITYDSDDEGELYDLAHDPLEKHNRWNDPECAKIRTTMTERLKNWRTQHDPR